MTRPCKRRIDAITRIVYDPTGKQTGEYYPENATHWFGKPIRRRQPKIVATNPTVSALDSTGVECENGILAIHKHKVTPEYHLSDREA